MKSHTQNLATILLVLVAVAACSACTTGPARSADDSETQASAAERGGDGDTDKSDFMVRCDLSALTCENVTRDDVRRACDEEMDGYSCHMVYLSFVGEGDRANVSLSLDYLRKACEYGHAPACTNYGAFMIEPTGRFEEALWALELACDGGRPLGCTDLGWMYEHGPEGITKDPVQALLLYADSCRDGVDDACRHVQRLADEQGGEIRADLEDNCDGGDGQACADLARLIEQGALSAGDADLVVELDEIACEADIAEACRRLGLSFILAAHDEAPSNDVDIETERFFDSMQLMKRACDGDDARACQVLAITLEDEGLRQAAGGGDPLDRLRQACALESFDACRALAEKYLSGDGVDADPEVALEIYREACQADDLSSCFQLGNLYRQGHGVDADIERARAAYTGTCVRGYIDGCMEAGYLLAAGEEVERDLGVAYSLFHQACDYGEMRACTETGTLYFFGQGADQDFERAMQYLHYACNQGDEEACRRMRVFQSGMGQ